MAKKEFNPEEEYNPKKRAELIQEEIKTRSQRLQQAQQIAQQEQINIVKLQGALEEVQYALSNEKVKK